MEKAISHLDGPHLISVVITHLPLTQRGLAALYLYMDLFTCEDRRRISKRNGVQVANTDILVACQTESLTTPCFMYQPVMLGKGFLEACFGADSKAADG